MERKQQSRKRLRPWLEESCNLNTYRGLRWLDREQKIFCISWKHQSSRSWEASDAEIPRGWALVSGKYKLGDPECPSDWKTRLRTALTKLSDIEEIKSLHKLNDPDNPYKAYKFLDEVPSSTSNANSSQQGSPLSEYSSTLSPSSSFQTSPVSQMDCLEVSDTEEMDVPCELPVNIPTVVNDVNDPKMETVMPRVVNTLPPTDSNQLQPNIGKNAANVPHMPQNILQANAEASAVPQQQASLPSDLESIDSNNLVPAYAKFADNMSIGSSLPSMPSLGSLGSLEHSGLKIKVFFKETCVLEESVDDKARLFCGDLNQHTEILECTSDVMVFGPMQLKQICIPKVDNMGSIFTMTAKYKELIQRIQNNMERGLLLGTNNNCVFAQRLCKARVFTWTPERMNVRLDRDRNDPYVVFDLNHFQQQLDDYVTKDGSPQPSPYVIFSFGQEYKADLVEKRQVLLYVKVVHRLAEKKLQQAMMEMENKNEGTDEVFVSNSNSGDFLAAAMKDKLKLKT